MPSEAQGPVLPQDSFFRSVLDTLNDCVIIADAHGKVTFSNSAAVRLLSIGPDVLLNESRVSMSGLFLPDCETPLPADQVPISRALRGESLNNVEVFVRNSASPDGVWLSVSGGPRRDEAGNLAGGIVVCRDITRKKNAETALLRERERLALAQTAAKVGVFEWDIQKDKNVWSPELELLYGIPVGSFGGTFEAWAKLLHPDDLRRAQADVVGPLANGGNVYTEWRVVWPDGSIHWLQARATIFRDSSGKPLRMLGVNLDITAQKTIEDKLLSALDALNAVVQNSPAAIWSVDVAGHVKLWNPAAERLFGWKEEDVLGKFLAPAADRALFLEALASVTRTDSFVAADLQFRSRQGDLLELDVSWSVLRDENEVPAAFLAIILDASERRRLESRIREAQKLESLSTLAGGVAHNFNNLLTGVLGSISLVLQSMPEDHADAGLLQMALSSGEKAANIARQMLAYSGKSRFVLSQIDLTAMVQTTGKLLQASLSRDTQLRISTLSDLPRFEADESQIQQLLTNLVINGAESLPGGSGEVLIRTGSRVLDSLQISQLTNSTNMLPGRYVFLEVRDTGMGMDRETLTKIFDPFFTTKFTGRGLGLAAALGIVRAHGGGIQVYSHPGRGTSFTVFFPAKELPYALLPPNPPDARTERRGILVVDDEPVVRQTAAVALTRRGYRVIQAADALEAIEHLSADPEQICLILLDLSMPNMDPETAMARLKAIKPEVPVVVSSGYERAEAVARFGSSLTDFLQKPFTVNQIVEKVESVLALTAAPNL